MGFGARSVLASTVSVRSVGVGSGGLVRSVWSWSGPVCLSVCLSVCLCFARGLLRPPLDVPVRGLAPLLRKTLRDDALMIM